MMNKEEVGERGMALIIVSESNEKQQLPKKEKANSGGQNPKRDVDNVESTNLKNNYKCASSGKKASRVSDDSDTKKEGKRLDPSIIRKDIYISDSRGKKIARNSVDSYSEYANKRKLKDENLPKRRTHIREEVEDYNQTTEGTCIDDDAGQRRGTVKDGYIISIIWIGIEVEPASLEMVKMMMATTNVTRTGTEATRRTGLEVMWLLEKLSGRDQVRRFKM
ncbi:LOW QUALITY PROTEIN: hypothetical protein YC2023_080127 [Brassica napus]